MATAMVIGAQWGDEGKGKIVDYLAAKADVVVRSQGGNNAGHTVVTGGKAYPLRLMPSGIMYPGTICIIGTGVVVGHPDPLRGQAVWAYVVMKDGYEFDEMKIRRHMSKNIASYKIPRRFIPMDALPKNATGKILKRALQDN